MDIDVGEKPAYDEKKAPIYFCPSFIERYFFRLGRAQLLLLLSSIIPSQTVTTHFY